jgi:hypothetical protein
MGSVFNYKTFEAESQGRLRLAFADYQSELIGEYGTNVYSGVMNRGRLWLPEHPAFPTVAAAVDYLENELSSNYDPAAVRARHSKTVAVKRPTFEGKSDSHTEYERRSYAVAHRLTDPIGTSGRVIPADQLPPAKRRKLVRLGEAAQAARYARLKLEAPWRAQLAALHDVSKGFSGYAALRAVRKDVVKAEAAQAKTAAALKAYDEELAKALYVDREEDLGEIWVVGCWCKM